MADSSDQKAGDAALRKAFDSGVLSGVLLGAALCFMVMSMFTSRQSPAVPLPAVVASEPSSTPQKNPKELARTILGPEDMDSYCLDNGFLFIGPKPKLPHMN